MTSDRADYHAFEQCQGIGLSLVGIGRSLVRSIEKIGIPWPRSPLGIVLDGFWQRQSNFRYSDVSFFIELADIIAEKL